METHKLCDFSDIAPIVKKLRNDLKMSREQAGAKTGCSAKTIERIENNDGDVGIAKLINLLDTLGYCLQAVPKTGLLDMELLQSGERY